MIGGYTIVDKQMAPYPYFVDVRRDGMGTDDRITAGVNQVVVHWASPIKINAENNKQRNVVRILESSKQSWTSDSPFIEPHYSDDQRLGFPEGKDQKRYLLGVAVEGRFDWFFKNKQPPATAAAGTGKAGESAAASMLEISRLIANYFILLQ